MEQCGHHLPVGKIREVTTAIGINRRKYKTSPDNDVTFCPSLRVDRVTKRNFALSRGPQERGSYAAGCMQIIDSLMSRSLAVFSKRPIRIDKPGSRGALRKGAVRVFRPRPTSAAAPTWRCTRTCRCTRTGASSLRPCSERGRRTGRPRSRTGASAPEPRSSG